MVYIPSPAGYPNKMFPNLPTLPLWAVLLLVLALGGLVGLINGFCVAKFKLHPFIVTLATQLILFGALLMYLMIGNNNGQSLSGLDPAYVSMVWSMHSLALAGFKFLTGFLQVY